MWKLIKNTKENNNNLENKIMKELIDNNAIDIPHNFIAQQESNAYTLSLEIMVTLLYNKWNKLVITRFFHNE